MGTDTYIEVSYKELNAYHSVVREKFSQPISDLPNKVTTYTSIIENIQKRLRGKTKQGTFIFSDTDRNSIEKDINDSNLTFAPK